MSSWGYGDRTIFMDASVLVYNRDGKFKEYVDFSRTRSSNGAIKHSGDVMDGHKREGSGLFLPITLGCFL